MISFIKKNYFYFVALIIFIIAAYVYCSPVLKGKKLYAGDNITGTAAVQECKKYHETTGDYSWWTGSMFCGMPNYQIGGNHYRSSDLLKPITWIHRGHGSPVAMIITYLICFFI